MTRWSHVALRALYFLPPIFLVSYFMVIFLFGIKLCLTPVIPVGVFFPSILINNESAYVFVSAVGVYDFVTWGWATKLMVSLTGLILSVLLFPLNIITAFMLSFSAHGYSLRDAASNAVEFIRFIIGPHVPLRQRWRILETLGCWITGYSTIAVIFVYIMQFTTVSPTTSIIVLPPLLHYVLTRIGDPALLLPFTPLSAFPSAAPAGVVSYIPTIPLVISIAFTGSMLGSLFFWVDKGRRSVERNMDAFMQWASHRKKT